MSLADQTPAADLVVRGGTVVTMDAARRVIEGHVVVHYGRISHVGVRQAAIRPTTKVIDARGCAVLSVKFRGPGNNLVAQLEYAASADDVRTTIVAGKVLMEDRVVNTINPSEVFSLVSEQAHHLAAKAGLRRG